MKYIITGSSGLIGSKLKERLDKDNECIMEIDNRKGSNVLNINSIRLTPSTQSTDIFFHLAAACKINECIQYPELAHINNCNGVFEALEFCRMNNIKKFVYMSSSRVLSPEENPYTASKKYGEALCEAYKQCYGVDYIIIRPSTVYDECHDLTTRLITKWVINALSNKPLYIYGDENKTLDFTHVDDFVDGIFCLLNNWDKAKNTSYDICGDDCRKLVDVADLIRKEIDKYKPENKFFEVILEEPERAQPQNVKIDITKIKSFGYSPKIKIEEGIDRLIKFYKTEGKKWLS